MKNISLRSSRPFDSFHSLRIIGKLYLQVSRLSAEAYGVGWERYTKTSRDYSAEVQTHKPLAKAKKATKAGFVLRLGFSSLRTKDDLTLPARCSLLAKAGKRTGVSGFSLIELLVATMIASILGTLLFSAFYQINRFVPAIDNRTMIVEKAALVNSQLEKDFAGIIVPNEFYDRQPKAKEKPEAEEKDGKQKDSEAKKKENALKQAQGDRDQKDSEAKKKPLEKIFYSVNKSGMLDKLSFLTTSSLQVYWGPKSGSAKPRIVRVQYLLKENPPSKDGKKSFSLIRKESSKLEYEDVEKSLEYVLADNIKSLIMDYTAVLIEPEKKPTQPETPGQKPVPAQKPELEVKQMNEWKEKGPSEEASKDQSKKQMPLVPQVISMDISFWDNTKKRSFPFVFTYKIPGEFALKKSTEDITGKMLGTLKEMFGQLTPAQNKPTQVAQKQQSPFTFGQRRR